MYSKFSVFIGLLLAIVALGQVAVVWADDDAAANKPRRILYNLDGCSCMIFKKDCYTPGPIEQRDVKAIVDELTQPGSQVDTLLVCINMQCTFYPSKVGTMRGTLKSPEARKTWPPREQQRFRNVEAMFARGVDPYALLLAEAKKRGVESLLTYRVNDAHDLPFLHCKFYWEHPEYRLEGDMNGGLDFGQEAVRDYTFRIIEEAVRRYDCDGIELDFNRFPTFFKDGSTHQRVVKINSLVERVRKMLDDVGRERGRRLVLAVRAPSNYGRTPTTLESSLALGCDVPAWVKNGWVDFVTVSEFLCTRYDMPLRQWKDAICEVPVYGGIEALNPDLKTYLSPEEYRRAARHLWAEGADGIYLFNFFCQREDGEETGQDPEPPFEVLKELGDPNRLGVK